MLDTNSLAVDTNFLAGDSEGWFNIDTNCLAVQCGPTYQSNMSTLVCRNFMMVNPK